MTSNPSPLSGRGDAADLPGVASRIHPPPPKEACRKTPPRSISTAVRTVSILGALLGVYLLTVGLDTAMARHMADGGRLQWLGSVPGVPILMEAYQWPAPWISRVPIFRIILEHSESFWWRVLDPPDTTP